MSTKTQHTALPWSHVADRNLECRHLVSLTPDEPGWAIEIGQVLKPGDAAFIVECVNSHAALTARVAKLEDALDIIVGFAPGNGDVCEIIARRARAALAPEAE